MKYRFAGSAYYSSLGCWEMDWMWWN